MTTELAGKRLADTIPDARAADSIWSSIDSFTMRVGDWLNPILVKESRQALKSKQFALTFFLLLVAAWGWTAIAILLLMPGIYYRPSGVTLLWGYYLVLAVPMLLVVPLAAHRSLAAEVDDGTLDLLSVTTLHPKQIISGKLASAALQVMLYFVTLLPCVAFAYLLRGIDLTTVVLLLGLTVGMAALLTSFGLFFAALPSGRTGQLGMMVLMLAIVVISQFAIASFAYSLINYGAPSEVNDILAVSFSFLGIVGTVCNFTLRAAAAQLSPPSENRSTPIRRAMILHQVAILAAVSYGLLEYGMAEPPVYFSICYMAGFWMFMGTLMVGESHVLSPRVRRELPSSFAARAILTWLTPGPSTGLVFAVSSFTGFCLALYATIVVAEFNGTAAISVVAGMWELVFILLGYLMLFLTIVRWLMRLIRKIHNPSPAIALAILVIVAGLLAVAPYSIALHLNEYRTFDWTPLQITNWAWTIGLALDNKLDDAVPYLILLIGCIVWSVSLVTTGRVVLPLRVATPDRVLAERGNKRENPVQEESEDPFA